MTSQSPGGPDYPGAAAPEENPVELQQQLYRYAEDLRTLHDRHVDLERSHASLVQTNLVMRENQQAMERLIDATHDVHLATDLDGSILQSNPAARALFRSGDLGGRNLYDLLQNDWLILDNLIASAREADNYRAEAELTLHRDGEPLAKLLTQVVMVHRQHEQSLLHWLMRDSLLDIDRGLEAHLSSMAFMNTAEAIMITDPAGVIVSVNPAFTKITGYEADEVLGKTPRVLNSGAQSPAFYEAFWYALKEKGAWQGELFNRRKNGEIYSQWLNITSARHADGTIASYISVFSDLTPLQETEKRLAFIAYHDTLTGLPNRELLLDRLGRATSQGRRSGQPFTLMFIDLDGFKAVNDRLGHEVGDRVLHQAARRLSESVREADTVARLGGDEFVIILPNLAGADHVGAVAQKLIRALSAPMSVDGETVFIGGSIGCAEFPKDSKDEQTLLHQADEAMYVAKQAGGNTHAFYQASDRAGGEVQAQPAEAKPDQPTEEQFDLFYQPQYDISVLPPRLVGVEALLRWKQGGLDELLPAGFIANAERNGTMGLIDSWTLRTACRQVRLWQQRGMPDLSLSVNVSSGLLRTPNFVNQVQNVLLETGLAPASLELEIEARDGFSDIEGDQSRLWLLWSLGVRLAIDGVGDQARKHQGNLLNLKAPPLSRLKIHPSVVTNLREGRESLAVCKSILAIGQAFGLEVTAVGVENKIELHHLRKMQCNLAQGFYMGPPMPPEEFAIWAKLSDESSFA
jgi:diguanylate cyclase (GGDEF)-like protein/PAS domain S-box-containing protein